ncbi:Lanosterol 14-alpha-demethylase [Coemansia sp. RSA 989]|nr:cytochrome P450 [Coemansia mojavensis]KAJ1740401.1 Lanosterol 14-alpha-demethylase [Coemansia sp. RSA 1086]KAJ1752037.1 Lanosterol 14-alpha-demethylase [Coemansia sp. RSA 1821]KAJ1867447.1 Lanosterol 14-alpha-demethylase [Coemansia sp. RSA 989]KAJ1874898.1 Lanosterol 14-alpha-demethylase [Coemansia sp. RSA 990]KAJ2671551.1 Lanosterol 14-alpha-demethylase [Coemansia sp. RSA 1085]
MGLFQTAWESYQAFLTQSPVACVVSTVLAAVSFLVAWAHFEQTLNHNPSEPPLVRYYVPFIGSMVEFGINPIKFIRKHQQQYGNFFTFLMFGRRMTVCVDIDGNDFVFNAKHSCVTAEDAYNSLTKPVFGEGVVYDVPNSVLMEQKRMVKAGLSIENFRAYLPIFVQEVNQYVDKHWTEPEGTVELLQSISEMIIMTASHTLLGPEIRSKLHEGVADLYHTLDSCFTPVHFLFEWLPLPSYYASDRAHAELDSIFGAVIAERRKNSNEKHTDMLDALMASRYKNGEPLSDKHVGNMLIALLMAGQHTSAATTTWALLNLASNPDVVAEARTEVASVMGREIPKSADLPVPTFEDVKGFDTLDRVVRETLRIRSPLVQVMRKVIKPVAVPNTNYVIPAGNYIVASPIISATDSKYYTDPEAWVPSRWTTSEADDAQDKATTDYGFGATTTSARSPTLPFGAGRHRCIGEQFAYLQIKTILYVLLSRFDFELDPKRGMPPRNFNSMVVLPEGPVLCRYKRRST